MSVALQGDAIARFDSDVDAESLGRALRTGGTAIVERALSRAQLSAIQEDFRPWFDGSLPSRGGFYGAHTRRFSALLGKAPRSEMLAAHPAILDAATAHLVGEGAEPVCDCIQLHLTQAIAIDPGEKAQVIHRDISMFPVPFPYEIMINVMWALDDFTAANGATRIVNGSQSWHIDRRPVDGEIDIAEAPAGSAIIWTGRTLHGGGANQTRATRHGLVFSYSLGWLAQAEKLLLSIPPEKARLLSPEVQRLIGYQAHRPNLGWVEGRDPMEWLKGETGELAQARDLLTDAAQARMDRLLAAEQELAD